MKPENVNLLQNLLVSYADDIHVDLLIPKLHLKGCLTKEEVETLAKYTTSLEKVQQLFKYLYSKDDTVLETLKTIFETFGWTDMIKFLSGTLAENPSAADSGISTSSSQSSNLSLRAEMQLSEKQIQEKLEKVFLIHELTDVRLFVDDLRLGLTNDEIEEIKKGNTKARQRKFCAILSTKDGVWGVRKFYDVVKQDYKPLGLSIKDEFDF